MSTVGVELSLGFVINGVVDPDDVLTKGGMKLGDQLVLTKPVGTGTLFAADMRGQAAGRDVANALAGMQQSNREAGICLRAHGSTSCTDVTGFGLLGHLFEMAKASDAKVKTTAHSRVDSWLRACFVLCMSSRSVIVFPASCVLIVPLLRNESAAA